MDEKITKKTGFTDTESSVFVDNSNKNTDTVKTSVSVEQNDTNPVSNSTNSAENAPSTLDFKGEKPSENAKNTDFYSDESKREFSRAFPEVDLEKLRNREEFQAFLSILCKNPSLSQAYACYNSIVSSAEKAAEKRVAQAIANAKASAGALASTESSEELFFTKEQVERMSREEIRRNLDKIRSSQAKW